MQRNTYRKQLGVALVEFTIVLPMMLLLLLGVSEIGRAIVQYNTLTKNTRAAARYVAGLALQGTTNTVYISAPLATETQNVLVYGNPNGAGSTNLPNLTTGQVQVLDAGGGQILVRVLYPYQPLTGGVLQTFGLGPKPNLGITLQSSVTMRAI